MNVYVERERDRETGKKYDGVDEGV